MKNKPDLPEGYTYLTYGEPYVMLEAGRYSKADLLKFIEGMDAMKAAQDKAMQWNMGEKK